MVFISSDKLLTDSIKKKLPPEIYKAIEMELFSELFTGKYNQQKSLAVRSSNTNVVHVSGLGNLDDLTQEKLRRITAKAIRSLIDTKVSSLSVFLPEDLPSNFDTGKTITEALSLGSYQFKRYKTSNHENLNNQQVKVEIKDLSKISSNDEVQRGASIARGTNFTRDLGNTAPNDLTPEDLCNAAQDLAEKSDGQLRFSFFDEDKMSELGMDMFLGVSKGSALPGRMVFLEYLPDGAKRTVAIVGKGITFDTGGISLKPGKGMDEMKYDMCGAAAVLGTMKAVVELQLPVNVIGVLAAAENMPDGKAQKPGDIVKAYNGKTVEILNTDAEGRLVLGDALSFTADHYKPDCMIDLATLTGACIVALGHLSIGAITNHSKLCESILEAGERTGDRVWQLPCYPEYGELIIGKHADLQNIGPSGEAGTVTAGFFLKHFVNDIPWVHLDIAGTAWGGKGIDYHPANSASGSGVRLLIDFLENLPELE
jgi:leucyl aminopeptidase